MNTSWDELAALYVLDRLDTEQRTAFEAQLARDPALVAQVRELESIYATRVRALPQHRPGPEVWRRIREQISAEPRPAARRGVTDPGRWSHALWALAAALAVAVTAWGVTHWVGRGSLGDSIVIVGLDPHGNSVGRIRLPQSTTDADARFVELASLADLFVRSPDAVAAAASPAGKASHGYALLDPRSGRGFIVIQRLPTLPAGKQFGVWLVDTRQRRTQQIGLIPPNGERVVYFFDVTLPPGATDHMDFLVTEEGGSSRGKPQGRVLLGDARI